MVFVDVAAEGTPVMPVFLEGIDDISLVMAAEAELEEIFFDLAVRNVIFGSDSFVYVAAGSTDEAHQIEWLQVGFGSG